MFLRLILLSFLISSPSLAAWEGVLGINYPVGGWDNLRAPYPTKKVIPGKKVKMVIPGDCPINVLQLKFMENEQPIKSTRTEARTTPDGSREAIYTYDDGKRILTHVGLYVRSDMQCQVNFFVESETVDPPAQAPEFRHCQKVAFLIQYDYSEHITQASALEGTPCNVFLRFKELNSFRFFLDDRRAKNLSPDFDILLPENVRVELLHRVGT